MAVDGPWILPDTLLPDGERASWWVREGRLTSTPVDGAEPLPGRFALPGLVDAHAHTSVEPGGPGTLDGTVARIRAMRDMGVLVIRDVGSPQSLTLRLRPNADWPTFLPAGRWHAPAGRFYAEFHDPVEPDQLIESALIEIGNGATWIKVIADFREPVLSYEPSLLRELVVAAHAAGVRVAAHTQWPVVRDVVAAGVDSIEHGCLLDRETLQRMAAGGIAWTPTLTAFAARLAGDLPEAQRQRYEGYLENYRAMLPFAAAAGVTILAGTDMAGTLVDEIRWLTALGLTPAQALRAASTAARTFLDVESLADGAPADLVTYEDDPREDPGVLNRPAAIILRGSRIT
jgi:imidazolonepropionase-like amidohydrolase